MNNGVMNFVLGLEAGGFTGALSQSASKLTGFLASTARLAGVGAMLSGLEHAAAQFGSVFAGIGATIERGAGLERLSRMTGESVASLYSLQAGLRAVGGDAESAGHMIMHMQHALGGVNEEGEPTGHIFAQLGLNISNLAKLDAPAAIQQIAQALSGLSNAQATAAAMHIFGREGAAQALALVRSTKEFGQALGDSAAGAARMQRSAAAFQQLSITFARLKTQAGQIFSGLAESVTPVLQSIVNWLAKIDFNGITEGFRNAFDVIRKAFSTGNIGELLVSSLEAGAERFGNVFFGMMTNSGAWASVWGVALGGFMDLMGNMEKLSQRFMTIWKALFLQGFSEVAGRVFHLKIPTFAETYAGQRARDEKRQDVFSAFAQLGKEIMKPAAADFAHIFAEVSKNAGGPAQQHLADLMSKLWAGVAADRAGAGGASGKTGAGAALLANYKPEHTALEKMGFTSRGATALATDHARQTAANTAKLVTLFQKIASAKPSFVGDILSNTHAV